MDLVNTKIFYKLNSFSHKFLTSSLEPKKKTKRLTIINPYFLQNILYTHIHLAMKSLSCIAVLFLLALTLPLAIASDPSPLQDFCVGVNTPASGGMHDFLTS